MEVPADWLSLGASLGIGLLIGLERERNASAKAGLRTFALVALLGWLTQTIGASGAGSWVVAAGLAAVAGMLIAANAAFKLGVIGWFGGRSLAFKAAAPMLASLAGGALALFI